MRLSPVSLKSFDTMSCFTITLRRTCSRKLLPVYVPADMSDRSRSPRPTFASIIACFIISANPDSISSRGRVSKKHVDIITA
jgi:hypothetical protein